MDLNACVLGCIGEVCSLVSVNVIEVGHACTVLLKQLYTKPVFLSIVSLFRTIYYGMLFSLLFTQQNIL